MDTSGFRIAVEPHQIKKGDLIEGEWWPDIQEDQDIRSLRYVAPSDGYRWLPSGMRYFRVVEQSPVIPAPEGDPSVEGLASIVAHGMRGVCAKPSQRDRAIAEAVYSAGWRSAWDRISVKRERS